MKENDIRALFTRHPEWETFITLFGSTWTITVITADRREFLIEVSPAGEVGVSDPSQFLEIDFSGHQWVFADLASAIEFVERSS